MRCEPAHREAYVRIRKAQVEYPQILSAFDAVAQWLAARGLPSSAPPREIYFANFHGAGSLRIGATLTNVERGHIDGTPRMNVTSPSIGARMSPVGRPRKSVVRPTI